MHSGNCRGRWAALDWLCTGSNDVLDFGCGNGSLLFFCARRGSRYHLGIDFSEAGISLANKRKALMPDGEFDFRAGDVSYLESIETASLDALILSNVIDNLIPTDAEKLLAHGNRILRPGGKVLVKLNPYLEYEQISEGNIKAIDGNLLDDGLLLWNQTTDEWMEMLSGRFAIVSYKNIFYEEHQQHNRLFLLVRE